MNDQLKKLIEDASSIAGNDHRLSKALNVPQVSIIQWKAGTRPCPPEEVASIAHIAGYDAVAWYVRATLWKFQGTAKGDRLAKVLGKSLPLTSGATASFTSEGAGSLTLISIDQTEIRRRKLIRCILC